MLLNIASETLHDSLGLTNVASPCHLGALHDTVLLHQRGVRVAVELCTLAANLHLLCDDAEAFGAIERCV